MLLKLFFNKEKSKKLFHNYAQLCSIDKDNQLRNFKSNRNGRAYHQKKKRKVNSFYDQKMLQDKNINSIRKQFYFFYHRDYKFTYFYIKLCSIPSSLQFLMQNFREFFSKYSKLVLIVSSQGLEATWKAFLEGHLHSRERAQYLLFYN